MLGVGVAEEAGLMGALIRKLVKAAPPWAISWIIVFIGVISSIASDAGYLILIPLAAAACLRVGRHPLAGLAAAYAGVSTAFGVNVLGRRPGHLAALLHRVVRAGHPHGSRLPGHPLSGEAAPWTPY